MKGDIRGVLEWEIRKWFFRTKNLSRAIPRFLASMDR